MIKRKTSILRVTNMFDLFRAKGMPDEYMVTVSLRIVNEFSNTNGYRTK